MLTQQEDATEVRRDLVAEERRAAAEETAQCRECGSLAVRTPKGWTCARCAHRVAVQPW